jgi:hypothetical protein
MTTVTPVIAEVLPVVVNPVKVTSAFVELFRVACTAVTPLLPESALTFPVAAVTATEAEVAV